MPAHGGLQNSSQIRKRSTCGRSGSARWAGASAGLLRPRTWAVPLGERAVGRRARAGPLLLPRTCIAALGERGPWPRERVVVGAGEHHVVHLPHAHHRGASEHCERVTRA